ncbi:hypothetical protein HII17_05470 [Thalassotalea sp. M1531]|uniref:Uncharacterized protein n=1 Tax=Thalassotalea algicola TaxID=2716224 RepID=A0A7Y0Q5H4_9GAMM|nr:hypothetical protein [Thalassotalea algicola]NMP31009.1 hypothetical protein [Thalassotalea algicola]
MKTKLKAIFAAAAVSSASLCFTVSHAIAAVPQAADYNLVIVNKYTSVKSYNDFGVSDSLYATEKFAQIFDKPLVKIPLDEKVINHMSPVAKKSDFFALATVFNDKLQQLIASFTHSTPSYSMNEEGEMTLKKHQNSTCNVKRS